MSSRLWRPRLEHRPAPSCVCFIASTLEVVVELVCDQTSCLRSPSSDAGSSNEPFRRLVSSNLLVLKRLCFMMLSILLWLSCFRIERDTDAHTISLFQLSLLTAKGRTTLRSPMKTHRTIKASRNNDSKINLATTPLPFYYGLPAERVSRPVECYTMLPRPCIMFYASVIITNFKLFTLGLTLAVVEAKRRTALIADREN